MQSDSISSSPSTIGTVYTARIFEQSKPEAKSAPEAQEELARLPSLRELALKAAAESEIRPEVVEQARDQGERRPTDDEISRFAFALLREV